MTDTDILVVIICVAFLCMFTLWTADQSTKRLEAKMDSLINRFHEIAEEMKENRQKIGLKYLLKGKFTKIEPLE